LPEIAVEAPARRSRLAQIFLAPFRDVDNRVALLAAANKAERTARRAVMSGAAAPQR
jgi:hypothetical protein